MASERWLAQLLELARYRRLVEELEAMENRDEEAGELFYLTTSGFQIEEPWFEDDGHDDGAGPESGKPDLPYDDEYN